MRSIENTAVNELIARAHDEPTLDTSHSTLPATMPVAAPFEEQGAGAAQAWAAALDGYIADSPTWSQATAPAWRRPASPRRLYELMSRPDRERMVPTFQIRRRSPLREVVGRLVLPIAVLVSTGVVIGAYVAFSGNHRAPAAQLAAAARPADVPPATPTKPARAAVAPAVVTPAPSVVPVEAAPRTAPVVAPAPPALVDVRIASTPSGATVTLVDRGRTQLVGDTPVDAAVDPSREYDLVFTYADGPPHVEHLDARTTRRVEVALDRHEPARPAPQRPERGDRVERVERAERPDRGVGTLMISSKPPCEIAIDGRATGLTTPQRAISLSAGSHRITLRNSEKSIRKTLTVQIAANATEKVIEDLMK